MMEKIFLLYTDFKSNNFTKLISLSKHRQNFIRNANFVPH